MATRTAVLGRGTVVGPGNIVLATVPLNETWIAKGVSIRNTGSVTANVELYATQVGTTFNADIFLASLAVNGYTIQTIWFVLGPGDKLQFFVDGSQFAVWVSGSRLLGTV